MEAPMFYQERKGQILTCHDTHYLPQLYRDATRGALGRAGDMIVQGTDHEAIGDVLLERRQDDAFVCSGEAASALERDLTRTSPPPICIRQSGYCNNIGISGKSLETGIWLIGALSAFPHVVRPRELRGDFEGQTHFGRFILRTISMSCG